MTKQKEVTKKKSKSWDLDKHKAAIIGKKPRHKWNDLTVTPYLSEEKEYYED